MKRVGRFLLRASITLLQALLITWAMVLPIVWILRDGLGPDSKDTVGLMAILKTLTIWGVPALVLVVPLCGLIWLERRVAGGKPLETEP